MRRVTRAGALRKRELRQCLRHLRRLGPGVGASSPRGVVAFISGRTNVVWTSALSLTRRTSLRSILLALALLALPGSSRAAEPAGSAGAPGALAAAAPL